MDITALTSMTRRRVLALAGASCAAACSAPINADTATLDAPPAALPPVDDWSALSEAQWRERLSEMQFYVLREEGTERAFTSPLDKEYRAGTYACAGCDLPLFESATKYDSGTGWPSFWDHIPGALDTKVDNKLWMQRIEYHCARCDGHQGHVFEDGPRPTGLRYCNNGVALTFKPA
ncbi:MAG: peptide-methionine (R)-S-oxide reductase MsrB [Pseudomonadota bacterium]